MTIIVTDIKNYESERMTEATDGGGLITGNTITCAEMNNIFPNISRIDRLYGRTQFRKIFPKIISPTTDTYSGCHLIVSEAPTDENIEIVLFDVGTKDDEHSDMISYFESYYEIGPRCGTATLAYQAEIGAESLVFQTEVVNKNRVYEVDNSGIGRWFWIGTSTVYTLPVTAGQVISMENGGNAEFLHVSKVEIQREYSPEDQFVNKTKYWTYTILYLAKPTTKTHAVGTAVYSKQINPDWWCYGTMRLSEAVAPGATNLPVVSEKVRVMPTVNMPITTASYPAYPSSTIIDSVTFGTSPYEFTLDGVLQPYVGEYKAVVTGQTVYVHVTSHKPILTDTVVVLYRAQNKWMQITEVAGVLQGDGAGTVDLANGVISLTTNIAPDESTHLIIKYQASQSYESYTGVTIGNPGSLPVALDFTIGNVVPGSVFFDITTDTGTYHIMDDSLGGLQPNFILFLADPEFNDVEYDTTFIGGTCVSEDSKVEYGNERYWWWSIRNQHQAVSTNGKSWTRTTVDDILINIDSKRLDFGTDETMMMVGDTYLIRRPGFSGTWVDLTANKPVPGETFHDVVYFEDATYAPSGAWIVVSATGVSQPIYSNDNGNNWQYCSVDPGPFAMKRVAVGVDGFGNKIILGANLSTYYTTPELYTEEWMSIPMANLGQACMDIACSVNTASWLIIGKTAAYMKRGGSLTIGSWTNIYPLIQALPEVAGRNMTSCACSEDGHWVISFSNLNVKEYVAISGDDGRHWTVYACDNGSWNNANNSGIASVCYDSLRQQFVWVQAKNDAVWEILFRSNILKINEFPFDPVGTIDYASGTGSITAGEDIIASITADLFLSKFDYKNFAFSVSITPPIIENSISVTARQDNDTATLRGIAEVGGSIVGDGTMTINHEHGYVYGEFDDSVQPDSIAVNCVGTALYHPEYDEYDSSRMPTDGLVPACKAGDTVIVSDGVNYDACIVTKVTKGLLSIAVESGLASGYASGTLVSAAVVAGDLQALEGIYFSESTWPGWFDVQQGIDAAGTWDDINYPATVVNNSCITERWSIEVTQAVGTTLVKVTGESVGIVTTNFDLHLGPDLAPTNGIAPRGGQLYLYYDGGTVLATVGETITGALSLNTAVVEEVLGDATSGMLILNTCSVGDFQDNEAITGSLTMVAVTNCASVQAFSSTYFTVPAAAWSVHGTFSVGDVFRFNTTGTEVPLWVLRGLNARTSDTASDSFILETRGDTA